MRPRTVPGDRGSATMTTRHDGTLRVDRPQVPPGAPGCRSSAPVGARLVVHGPRHDPPHDDGAGVVEPDHGVGAGQDEVLHLRVVAVDDPSGPGDPPADLGAELLAGKLLPVGLMEDRVELDVGQGEAVRELAGERRLPGARATDDQDPTHACILAEEGAAILSACPDLDDLGTARPMRELAGNRIFTIDAPARRRGAPRAAPGPARLPDRARSTSTSCSTACARTGASVLLDFLGFGFSDKPDSRYTHARCRPTSSTRSPPTLGLAAARAAHPRHGRHRRRRAARPQHRRRVARRRSPDACSPTAASTSRWRTSRAGQQLLARPARRAPRARARSTRRRSAAGVAGTFSPHSTVDDDELAAHVAARRARRRPPHPPAH